MIRFFPLFFMVLLAACSTVETLPPDHEGTPEQHQETLNGLSHWYISGRAAIKNGSESWQVNLLWLQQSGEYRIRMFGPFGAGQVQLSGGPTHAELLTSDDERYRASNADQLLYDRTGVRMPVNELRHWIIGQSAPNGHSRTSYDRHGRLVTLEQGAWRVRYRRYTAVNGLVLPSKIFAKSQDLDVRLVIDEWQLGVINEDNPFYEPG